MLNTQQSRAVDTILYDFKNGATASALSGSPGTGKTHTTGEAARQLFALGTRIAIAASTNKAVDVIQNAARNAGWHHYVSWWGTVHKLLGLVYDPKDEQLHRYGSGHAYRYGAVIVDEASMLDSEIVATLRSEAKFVLFVGDENQLPPINEDRPIAFMVKGANLTDSVRQDNPDIKSLVDYLTLAMDRGYERIPKELVQPFVVDNYIEWQDSIGVSDTEIALAWTNQEVGRINRVIRARLNYKDEYCYGEKVVFTAPVYKTAYSINELVFSTSEIGVIRDVARTNINGFPCYNLRIKTPKKEAYVHVWDTAKMDYIQFLLDDGAQAPEIAKIKHAYALTTHRSQGGEWDTVHVNLDNIRKCQDFNVRRKLMYVAVSRARKHLRLLISARAV
jgi:ATP-dependent exoDNAse (exonuclease V) alpha subunit